MHMPSSTTPNHILESTDWMGISIQKQRVDPARLIAWVNRALTLRLALSLACSYTSSETWSRSVC